MNSRSTSLDQEEPESLQNKEEVEEIGTSQEQEQLELKQEADTFMLSPEQEPDTVHQLLSAGAESQDQSFHSRMSVMRRRFSLSSSSVTRTGTPGWTKRNQSLYRLKQNLPQKGVLKEEHEEVLTEQQLCNQERNSSMDQDKPESLQIKEEEEEICTSQEQEQLELKQEADTFMLSPDNEESDHIKPEREKHVCNICKKCFRQKHSLMEHMRNHEDERPFSCKTCGQCFRHSSELTSHKRSHTELWQQHIHEEEVLTDQERKSSLEQEEPESLQIKEDQGEICISQEGETKLEAETILLTPDPDHMEPEPVIDHQ
uniref:zinc finger protein with KRAB and SCAN domains 3-like n=1 Tax=Solea senegalensis TaxID=28829 RepID=UPI001CD917E9|nr:zinc finger protein with KRAB and SCAN domains 3-like [Solea senegalensis]